MTDDTSLDTSLDAATARLAASIRQRQQQPSQQQASQQPVAVDRGAIAAAEARFAKNPTAEAGAELLRLRKGQPQQSSSPPPVVHREDYQKAKGELEERLRDAKPGDTERLVNQFIDDWADARIPEEVKAADINREVQEAHRKLAKKYGAMADPAHPLFQISAEAIGTMGVSSFEEAEAIVDKVASRLNAEAMKLAQAGKWKEAADLDVQYREDRI